MSKFLDQYKVGEKLKLKHLETNISKKLDTNFAKEKLKKIRKKLAKFQDVMLAHDKYNVLICLQGMDASGKDSLVRQVFQKFNAKGLDVESFGVPSEKEKQHDYLWRHYLRLPEKGHFGIFNRTHYENVLVSRVHKDIVLNENIPEITSVEDIKENFWEERLQQIQNFEKHLAQTGTIVLKFFLNISKNEQKNRILRRIERPDKNWKFSPSDISERAYWDEYMSAYEEAIDATNKEDAPWFVIPADDKNIARYLVAKIIYKTVKKYKNIEYPELPKEIKEKLDDFKKVIDFDTKKPDLA